MKTLNWRLNSLIGLNCFIVFFLLVEHLVRIPSWLHVLGRMHPMVLHFPIVMLFIVGVLVNFRKPLQQSFPVSRLIHETLFIAAVSAGLTVIMGLLLAQEDGYEGNSFLWHKWTGVAISFASWGLVWMQSLARIPYQRWFVIATNVCLCLVLVAGHFGATLTHGEQFILSPLKKDDNQVFDIHTAQVFDDAILPILKAKCLSCHRTGKSKGELVLSDSATIAIGGESGALFMAGNPTESLLIQRLMLDVEHEHHMPPKGKPQLSPEELTLLQAWVAEGAKFDAPVASLDANDSLRLAIAAVYQVTEEEHFDFPAADADLIKKLSTPYRVIRVRADGSPALSVNFYGVGSFTDQSLAELEPLASQVVSLNLSSMPVGAKGMETIAKFVNLRDINLNDTPIEDQSLEYLNALENLRSAKLNGTALTIAGLKHLLANDALRQVFIWNTAVDDDEAAQLAEAFPAKTITVGYVDDGQTILPLTEPQITPTRTFFRDKLEVAVSHPIPEVQIRYSLDGSEPDSLTGMLFDDPISIDSNQQLAVKAYKEGWAASPTVIQKYMQSEKTPDRIVMEGRPHTLYPARREQSFFDLESGGRNHADGKWQGYFQSPLSAVLYFNASITIDTLALSVMQNYSGITYMPAFAPEYIEVWGGSDTTEERLLTKVLPDPDKPEHLVSPRLIHCPINASVNYLKVIAQPYRKIPDGYPGAGAEAWLFVDEIILK